MFMRLLKVHNVFVCCSLILLFTCEKTTQVELQDDYPYCKDGKGLYLEMNVQGDTLLFSEDEQIITTLCSLPNVVTKSSNWDAKWHPDLITRQIAITIRLKEGLDMRFECWASFLSEELDTSSTNIIVKKMLEEADFRYGEYEEWEDDFIIKENDIEVRNELEKPSYCKFTLLTDEHVYESLTDDKFTVIGGSFSQQLKIDLIEAVNIVNPDNNRNYTHIIEGSFNTFLDTGNNKFVQLKNGRFRLPIKFP